MTEWSPVLDTTTNADEESFKRMVGDFIFCALFLVLTGDIKLSILAFRDIPFLKLDCTFQFSALHFCIEFKIQILVFYW